MLMQSLIQRVSAFLNTKFPVYFALFFSTVLNYSFFKKMISMHETLQKDFEKVLSKTLEIQQSKHDQEIMLLKKQAIDNIIKNSTESTVSLGSDSVSIFSGIDPIILGGIILTGVVCCFGYFYSIQLSNLAAVNQINQMSEMKQRLIENQHSLATHLNVAIIKGQTDSGTVLRKVDENVTSLFHNVDIIHVEDMQEIHTKLDSILGTLSKGQTVLSNSALPDLGASVSSSSSAFFNLSPSTFSDASAAVLSNLGTESAMIAADVVTNISNLGGGIL